MDRQCKGVNATGQRCDAKPVRPSGWCFWHDPALEAQRAEGRRQGGQSRSNKVRAKKALGESSDLIAVQAKLVGALEKVEDGTLDPARAQAMASLARAIVAVAVPGELSERLAAMERALAGRGAS